MEGTCYMHGWMDNWKDGMDIQVGENVCIRVRNRDLKARIVKPPFRK